MSTGWWAVVFFAVVAVVAAVWVGNTLRWTRANDNLARRGTKAVGRGTGARRRGLPLVVGIVVTGISVVALVWSILYATAN
ncbi:hypothetical protein SAMN03159343_1373 [Klenkia marina]|uniref:Uncharacterized protein n=1 Tax=Klenkia marina TaxID=1960309 RepID=A0A1G4XSQ5_9ACTN|nr:hypothetical protein [Klenkia marina]SCX44197.1 hypothetical protein SAMN03159343_1373 [Klenkia marina]